MNQYHIGDTRAVLKTLPAGSVDLIVSSPPFLALRSYLPADHPDKPYEIGSESTPGEFLDVLLDVVEECARVLAPHGSLCFELGDTYSSCGGITDNRTESLGGNDFAPRGRRGGGDGWPLDKSLCLIPQSFAFALSYGRNPHTGRTTDPWRVRNIVRWWRPNPPVGALGDKWRPATSEITVACKSARRYWDDIATRTEYAESTIKQHGPQAVERRGGRGSSNGDKSATTRAMAEGALTQPGAPLQDTWRIPTAPYRGSHYATYPPALVEPLVKAMAPPRVCNVCGEPSRRIISDTDDYAATKERNAGKWPSAMSVAGAHSAKDAERVTRLVETVGWTDCGHNDWRRAVILDPFAGTGTTLMVAQGHGHDTIGIDLDARNADLARERLGMFLEVVA